MEPSLMNRLLCLLGLVSAYPVPSLAEFDLLACLPVEVACHVLRLLDDSSLLSAVSVSKEWYSMVLGDPVLRRRVRSILAQHRANEASKENLQSYSVHVQRVATFLSLMTSSSKGRVSRMKQMFTKKRKLDEVSDAAQPPTRKLLRL